MEEKHIFYQHYEKYYQKKPNKRPWNMNRLNEVAAEIIAARSSNKKSRRDYYLLKTYDVVTIGEKYSVIRKVSKLGDGLQYIVAEEEIYDKLLEIHVNCGHGSRDKMIHIIQQSSVIHRPCVEMFLRSCKTCQTKKNKMVSKIVVKPILTKDFMTRGLVDLIDLQSIADGDFKWILNYQDHATKFICLRPLRSKLATEVAEELLKIFLQFGAPAVLQSDNGREFACKVIQELKSFWPQLCIVHGRPRHPQSQGSVERSNQNVENMLRAWMSDNKSTTWSRGCYVVQWQKNNSLHRVIGRSPYKAVFGVEAKLGLKSTSLPDYMMSTMTTEEDLEAAEEDMKNTATVNNQTFNEKVAVDNNVLTADEIMDNINTVPEENLDDEFFNIQVQITSDGLVQNNIHPITCICCGEETHECIFCKMCNISAHTTCLNEENMCNLCATQQSISNNQANCYIGLKRQAEQMISVTKKKLQTLNIGDCVLLNVDKVDRSPGDPPNIVCIVTDYKNNVFQVGTADGLIKAWFNRADLQKAPSDFLKLSQVDARKLISVREAVSANSLFKGQGYVKCACQPSKCQCQNNRCQCFKQKKMCNSRCHKSNPCANK